VTLIQSIGPPPERHADRVIGEMMRKLVRERAELWDMVGEVFYSAGWSGSVRAQRPEPAYVSDRDFIHSDRT